MSTRKSRQLRGLNLLSKEDFENLGNSDEEDKDNRSIQEKEIDKKLSESGLEDAKELPLQQKKALIRTLNASVSTAEYEKRVRSSPKVEKLKNSEEKSPLQKPKEKITPITLENSDGASDDDGNKTSNQSDTNINQKKTLNPFLAAYQTVKNVLFLKSDSSEIEKQDTSPKVDNKKLLSDSENDNNHINFIKKSGFGAEDEKNLIDISSDEDSEKVFPPSKKRPSPPETDRFECIKRLKMDRSSIHVNKPARTPLKTEIELAKRQQSTPFKRRSIRAILNEIETANKMYKEASLKYRFPVRWGAPIIKNCERWDSQNIPQKLINRYQQYLTNNDLSHPAFIPPIHEFETSAIVEPFRNYQTIEDDDDEDIFRIDTKSRAKDESKSDFDELKADLKVTLDNVQQENVKNTPKQGSARKTRGRGQQKKIDLDFDTGDDGTDNVIDSQDHHDSEEWLPKNEKKSKKNGKTSKHGKNFIKIDGLNRTPIVKVERLDNEYKFFKSKNAEVPEKGGKAKNDDVIHISQDGENSQQEKDGQPQLGSELVDCPICNKKFKKDLIENHAQECATKTFQD